MPVLSIFNSRQQAAGAGLGGAALDACRRILSSLANHAIEAQAEPTVAHRAILQTLVRQVTDTATPESLEHTCGAVDRELSRWHAFIRQYHDDREQEMREILKLTGEATTVVTSQSDKYAERLRSFGQNLQTLAQRDNLTEVRRGLNQQVTTMRVCMEEMRKQSEGAVMRLEGQMQQFQQRLALAEQLAATDSLTGALNRRGGEARLEQFISRGSPFSLLLFDLNRFKVVNDTWGHAAGDQVLRHFADRVRQVLRPGDFLCRWGGDEFIALLPSSQQIGDARIGEIQSRVRGFYKIVALGKELQVDVSASVGLVQYEPGEGAESVLSRADAELYRNKTGRPSTPAALAAPYTEVESSPSVRVP